MFHNYLQSRFQNMCRCNLELHSSLGCEESLEMSKRIQKLHHNQAQKKVHVFAYYNKFDHDKHHNHQLLLNRHKLRRNLIELWNHKDYHIHQQQMFRHKLRRNLQQMYPRKHQHNLQQQSHLEFLHSQRKSNYHRCKHCMHQMHQRNHLHCRIRHQHHHLCKHHHQDFLCQHSAQHPVLLKK